MPVVKLLSIVTTNSRASWPVRAYKAGCLRFMIEHRSRSIRLPSGKQYDPDFSVRALALEHQRY